MPYAKHPCPSCARAVSNRFVMCRACRNKSNTGSSNPNWKGGRSTDRQRYKRIQRERYPLQARARWTVDNALRAGKLERQPCQWPDCQAKGEAHHWNYHKPLVVGWYCRPHHRIVDSLTQWWSATMEHDQPVVYFWKGHLLAPDGEPFEMAGALVQPVVSRIDDPCFISDGKHKGMPTRYGWVDTEELMPIDAQAYADARDAWLAAMRDSDRVGDLELPHGDVIAVWDYERQAGQVFADLIHANNLAQSEAR